MPDFDDLYGTHSHQMEDFWSRRVNTPTYRKTIHVFGHSVHFESNHEKVLDAAALAEPMYSTCEPHDGSVWHVHLTVHDPEPAAESPPERLIDRVHYAGTNGWLSIGLGEWGHCMVDLERGEAFAVLASALARHPRQVCQVLINTILTNFITRHGYSMLHASALVRGQHLLLLQAPHGTGKSTTALRLLLNGYQLLSDSMVYIAEREGELWMGGFPVGTIKLRTDMLPWFPDLAREAQPEPVRHETKHRVDLMRIDPALTRRDMLPVRRVEYCLLERWDRVESSIEPLAEADLWPEIMVNSLHYDTPGLWHDNLRRIDRLVRTSTLHRLRIGTSADEILKTVDQLW